ncbi:uncharacterized protein PAC_18966 [Phialocephala subalpina]|uniref:Zn(2)-C6 fungal-type domain-containing protein n=1 Tax=Phialocephala subalpina TaxID=576137 RepID=A0A1L7XVS1_9HELO|nr:uncharacterized protein PAC_18966 [Phialocephala subalpina]
MVSVSPHILTYRRIIVTLFPFDSISCREKHYRCDNNRPKCSRCCRVKRSCVREPQLKFLFDQSLPRFQTSQTWVALPKRVDFFDETAEIIGDSQQNSPLRSQDEIEGSTHFSSSYLISHSDNLLHEDQAADTLRGDTQDTVPTPPSTSVDSSLRLGSDSSKSKFPSAWPLSTPLEAHLLRHWVENVSGFFDFLDPGRPFAIEVPQRARANRTLANAVFALSARHLSGTTVFDPLVADHHLQECLRTLIPTLEDSEAVMNDDILAALVILRMLEEMDVPFVGSDLQRHLFGTQAIIRAQRTDRESSNLCQAARWCAFRQEIFGSLNAQRAFQLTMTPADINWATTTDDDGAWACRAVLHCRDAIQFSFGGEGMPSRHAELVEDNIRWRTSRPTSFDPFYVYQGQKAFPHIRMHMDWHTMASQYNILAHILLAIHDPGIPKCGPSYKKAIRAVDHQVREDVRALCGGDRFTDSKEQNKLEDILVKTEQLHGWPTKVIQQQLRLSWHS